MNVRLFAILLAIFLASPMMAQDLAANVKAWLLRTDHAAMRGIAESRKAV